MPLFSSSSTPPVHPEGYRTGRVGIVFIFNAIPDMIFIQPFRTDQKRYGWYRW